MSTILEFGKETVFDFIQTKIRHGTNVKEDILDKIKYVPYELTNDAGIKEDYWIYRFNITFFK